MVRISAKRMRAPAIALLLFDVAIAVGNKAAADVFNVEVDWMVLSGQGGHDHGPAQADIDAVVQMFACHGHVLNVAIGNAVPHYDLLVRDPNNPDNFFGYSGVPYSFGRLKQDHFAHAGQPGWHYCIFVHRYTERSGAASCSSGLGELGGDDFIVSLGCFSGQIGAPFDRAATFAHEFGHNLGLDHCAFGDCTPTGPYQENYPSIMSYFYQLRGVRSNLLCQGLSFPEAALFKEIDFSNGTMCRLDENALDERFGTGMIGVDWNCDGNRQGIVTKDLNGDGNGWCAASSALQVLADKNDWAQITDFARTKTPEELDRVPIISCISPEEAAMVAGGCPQPDLTTESCISARMGYVTPSGSFPYSGECSAPMIGVRSAHNALPVGSAVFLGAGTYHETVPLILDKPLQFSCPGSAVASSAVIMGP